jgi:hypothetical protein
VNGLVTYTLRDANRHDQLYGEEIPDEEAAFQRAQQVADFYGHPIEVCRVTFGHFLRVVDSVRTAIILIGLASVLAPKIEQRPARLAADVARRQPGRRRLACRQRISPGTPKANLMRPHNSRGFAEVDAAESGNESGHRRNPPSR